MTEPTPPGLTLLGFLEGVRARELEPIRRLIAEGERRETEQQYSLAARPRGRDWLIQCGLNHKNVDWVHTDTP
ncbi:hypothetical protein [Streptomyces griseosporeus]|uniref:hypothetical protein n=1 Tax=Streptomyces griseosporeus TaxID=1910 RepID=UPI0037BC05C2